MCSTKPVDRKPSRGLPVTTVLPASRVLHLCATLALPVLHPLPVLFSQRFSPPFAQARMSLPCQVLLASLAFLRDAVSPAPGCERGWLVLFIALDSPLSMSTSTTTYSWCHGITSGFAPVFFFSRPQPTQKTHMRHGTCNDMCFCRYASCNLGVPYSGYSIFGRLSLHLLQVLQRFCMLF